MPAIELFCDSCDAGFRTRQRLSAGQRVRCPSCRDIMVVPNDEDDIEEDVEEIDERERSGKARDAKEGRKRPRRRPRDEDEDDQDVEEDFDDEDDPRKRKRKRRRRGSSGKRGGVMAYVVIGIAVFGTLTAGFLGAKWVSDANSDEFTSMKTTLDEIVAENPNDPRLQGLQEKIDEINGVVTSAYLLLFGVVLAITACVFAFLNKGLIAGPLLLLAFILPGIFAWQSMVFSCPLLIAGGLAFLLRSD